MPFFGGFQYSINNNRIVYVADVVIPAAFKITVDTIQETTPNKGITVVQNSKSGSIGALGMVGGN